ncbi:MAG: hypothetical protein ACYS8W_09095 [Planctomycetota bacterium]|jgi:hypothetical protein
MKSLPLKLGIFVVLLFFIVITVCFVWKYSREKSDTTPEVLDTFSARHALARLIDNEPDTFTSPGRSETSDGLNNASIINKTTGNVTIGLFSIDLDNKTYSLMHCYGKSGDGWFEDWMWNGIFEIGPDGEWMAKKPEFRKAWGE